MFARRNMGKIVYVVGVAAFIYLMNILVLRSLPPTDENNIDVSLITSADVWCANVEKESLDFNNGITEVTLHIFVAANSVIENHVVYRPFMNCVDQEDKDLVRFVRKNYFVEPSTEPYNFTWRDPKLKFTTVEEMKLQYQAQDIVDLVYKRPELVPRNGFFIEAGSMEGGLTTVSLGFELKYGWRGLLVEAVTQYFQDGLNKHRKTFNVNTCLGILKRPHNSFFNFITASGWEEKSKTNSMPGLSQGFLNSGAEKMQCIPLYTLILAAGNPKVNVLVLDVEGAELGVLKTIPWNKVDIEIMSVETDLIGDSIPGGSQESIRKYIESQGYRRFPHRNDFNNRTQLQQNDLFVREDVVHKYNVVGYSQ